jgi:hypothetical protein
LWERFAEVPHHARDRGFLVEAWHQHGNSLRVVALGVPCARARYVEDKVRRSRMITRHGLFGALAALP